MKATLPDLDVHVTPDVFNGLVNIVEVIKVVNAEEQMQDLIKDKMHLWEKAIVKCYLKVKGTRQSLGSWTYQYMVLSGSYIYFYERSKDLMPANHFYACDWAIVENAAGTEASIVTIKSNKQEVVLLDFCGNLDAKKQFCEGLLELQIYLRGGNVVTFMPELVHADPTDLRFLLELTGASIKLCLHRDNSPETLQALTDPEKRKECAWIELLASNSKLFLKLYEFEINVGIEIGDAVLSSGWLMPHLREKCGPPKMPSELWDRFAHEPQIIV